MLIGARTAAWNAQADTAEEIVPYVMTSMIGDSNRGFTVPWAAGTDSAFQIRFGFYIPSGEDVHDGERGFLAAKDYPMYRIFTLHDFGFFFDTSRVDAGRRTCWNVDWKSTSALGDWRGTVCVAEYHNSDRSGKFTYKGLVNTSVLKQGYQAAIYPSYVQLLNGTPSGFAHAIIFAEYISGNGTVIHRYVPEKSGNSAVLKDEVTGVIYNPVSPPENFTYGELKTKGV